MQTVHSYLLGLAAARVSDKEGTVVLDEGFLDLLLGSFVNVLLVEGDDGLGESLTEGIDLGDLTCIHPNI